MSISPILTTSVAMIMLVACSSGSNDKDFQTPDNTAYSPYEVPLYRSADQAKPYGKLPRRTVVYPTKDSISANGEKYVRIVWGDSSAYAPTGWLIHHAREAVMLSDAPFGRIPIYEDPAMTHQTGEWPYWSLEVVGDEKGGAVPIMFFSDDKPKTGYVSSNLFQYDDLNIEFYKAYHDAASYADKEKFKDDPKYAGLKIYGWLFPTFDLTGVDERGDAETGEDFDEANDDDVYAEGDGEYGDVSDEQLKVDAFIAESGWVDGDILLRDDQAPGTFKKYFQFADGSEMAASGYSLYNGKPYAPDLPAIDKKVTRIRFEVIPNKKCWLVFYGESLASGMVPAEELFTDEYKAADVEPGKPYSAFISNSDDAGMFCKLLRVSVRADRTTAAATVYGSCDR